MEKNPRFIFFKMFNCKACDTFLNTHWGLLVKDQDMRDNFDMILYEFGKLDDKTIYPHDKYNFVKQSPMFAIEFNEKNIINLGSFITDRTKENIKQTALKILNDNKTENDISTLNNKSNNLSFGRNNNNQNLYKKNIVSNPNINNNYNTLPVGNQIKNNISQQKNNIVSNSNINNNYNTFPVGNQIKNNISQHKNNIVSNNNIIKNTNINENINDKFIINQDKHSSNYNIYLSSDTENLENIYL